MGKRGRHEEVGASAYVFDQGLSLSTKGTKGRNYKGDYPHASTRGGAPGWATVVTGTRQPLGHDGGEKLVEAVKKCRLPFGLVWFVWIFCPRLRENVQMRSKPRGKRAQSPGHGT